MCFPGLYILFEGSFKLMALPALALVFIVTLVLLRLQPRKWIPDEEAYWIAFNVFRKVCITMGVYMVRPLAQTLPTPRRRNQRLAERAPVWRAVHPCGLHDRERRGDGQRAGLSHVHARHHRLYL